jgi:hypothetical protein
MIILILIFIFVIFINYKVNLNKYNTCCDCNNPKTTLNTNIAYYMSDSNNIIINVANNEKIPYKSLPLNVNDNSYSVDAVSYYFDKGLFTNEDVNILNKFIMCDGGVSPMILLNVDDKRTYIVDKIELQNNIYKLSIDTTMLLFISKIDINGNRRCSREELLQINPSKFVLIFPDNIEDENIKRCK